jgi:Hint domain
MRAVRSRSSAEGPPRLTREVGFVEGTKLLTTEGYRPVQSLRKGDLVLTLTGRPTLFTPIEWVGSRILKAATRDQPTVVRILPHAIGNNMPFEDVVVAAEHGIFLEWAFYLPRMLANGASIIEENGIGRNLWVIELERHDILLASGLPIESYLRCPGDNAFTAVTMPVVSSLAEYRVSRSA